MASTINLDDTSPFFDETLEMMNRLTTNGRNNIGPVLDLDEDIIENDDESNLRELANPSKLRPHLTTSNQNGAAQQNPPSLAQSRQQTQQPAHTPQTLPFAQASTVSPPPVFQQQKQQQQQPPRTTNTQQTPQFTAAALASHNQRASQLQQQQHVNAFDEKDNEDLDDDDEELDGDDEEFDEEDCDYEDDDERGSVLSKISQKSSESEKLDLLMKLDDLRTHGHVVRDFNLSNRTIEIKKEVHRLERTINLKASIKFQQKMLMFIVSMIEYGNKKFDPLSLELDGWSENVFENIEDFNHVFERLYDKYKRRGEMAPEIELMLTLAGSAFMFNMTNQLFKSVPQPLQAPMRQLRQTVRSAFNESQRQQQQQQQQFANGTNVNDSPSDPRSVRAGPSLGTSGSHGIATNASPVSILDSFSPLLGTLGNLVVPQRMMPEMASHGRTTVNTNGRNPGNSESIRNEQFQSFQNTVQNSDDEDDDRFSLASSSESIVEPDAPATAVKTGRGGLGRGGRGRGFNATTGRGGGRGRRGGGSIGGVGGRVARELVL